MLTLIKAAIFVLAASSMAAFADQGARGPIILTVSGQVANASRGPIDPDYDKFMAYNGVTFQAGAEYDYVALSTLGQVKVTTDFPQGGAMHNFEGPYLADVLRMAGATGRTVSLRALDGYALELPLAELLAQQPILALKRDGDFLGLGNFGPMQLVFARGTDPALADLDDSTWIWSVFQIHVE